MCDCQHQRQGAPVRRGIRAREIAVAASATPTSVMTVEAGETGNVELASPDAWVRWVVEDRVQGAPDVYDRREVLTGPASRVQVGIGDQGATVSAVVLLVAAGPTTGIDPATGIPTAAAPSPLIRAVWRPGEAVPYTSTWDDVTNHYRSEIPAQAVELPAVTTTTLGYAPGLCREVNLSFSAVPTAVLVRSPAGTTICAPTPATTMTLSVGPWDRIDVTAGATPILCDARWTRS